MKIRDGHVSNSSSSSFVVAFPRKPKTAKDVLEFMFDGKEGGLSLEYSDDGLSYRQVTERVFNDIDRKNAITATLARVVEEFSSRYHYSPNIPGCGGHCFYMGGNRDEDGGSWSEKRDRYFGADEKLIEEFKALCIKDEKEEEELRKEERRILDRFTPQRPQCAYKDGIDSLTKKPYTKEQINTYNKWEKDYENFRKTDPEFLAYDKKRWATLEQKWKRQAEVCKKLAEVDAKNFLKDNKGKFIFIVSYDDGSEAVMEHGRIFRNVPHVRVNHH